MEDDINFQIEKSDNHFFSQVGYNFWESGRLQMKPLRDPEGAELSHLLAACELPGARVLEIGCGNGFLTRQYAALPALVAAIDPNAEDLREAAQLSAQPQKVFFSQATAERLPFPAAAFEVVLFASSF